MGADRLAPSEKLPFLLTDFNIREHLIEMLARDQGAHLCSWIERISYFDSFYSLHEPFHHLVVDLLVYKQARTGQTNLPLIAESGTHSRGYRLIKIGIIKDDIGPLAAQFKREFLERIGRSTHDGFAGGSLTGKRNRPDIWMESESLASRLSAKAVYYIEYTRR
ncbi:MAG: hypothetical protein BWY75_03841 [bacterium ADurb.Bin425]|nr:MAG: hypothetical protein BWY75_03841 [bacterium ADurb.Bin425]